MKLCGTPYCQVNVQCFNVDQDWLSDLKFLGYVIVLFMIFTQLTVILEYLMTHLVEKRLGLHEVR